MLRLLILIVVLLFSTVAHTLAQEQPSAATSVIQKEWIRSITPDDGAEIIGKRPDIEIEYLEASPFTTLVVLIDGTDVTPLLITADNGFKFKPVVPLNAGAHTLSIIAVDKEGGTYQRDISFKTRDTAAFEEAYSNNEASVTYESVLVKPDSSAGTPNSKIEGNLSSTSKIKEKSWEFQLATNLRYFDQSIPATIINGQQLEQNQGQSILNKGLSLVDFLLIGKYTKDQFQLRTEIGDVLVDESPYTVSGLARRGGKLGLTYKDIELNSFAVRGDQVYGFYGGLGIGMTSSDHITGVSAAVKMFDKKMEVKTIYSKGGTLSNNAAASTTSNIQNTYGITTTPGPSKGEVVGFLITSDFFENRLRTEMEASFSKFDPDTTDEFEKKSDHAYRLRIDGMSGVYTYEALYEYIGRDYAVTGNEGLQKDRQGLALRGGANFGIHMLNVGFSRYNDNVKSDDIFPRIVSYQANIDYSFTGINNLPIGINYHKSVQESTKEPAGSTPVNMDVDTISAQLNYLAGSFNLGFISSYSLMNDKTAENNDTTTMTFTLVPSYASVGCSVSSILSYNKSKVHATNVWTDTYTAGLNFGTRFLRDKAFFDTGSTYTIVKADDSSVNTKIFNANFRLGYDIKELFRDYLNPSVSLWGGYEKITDKVASNLNRDEFKLFIVFATAIPFSF